MKYFVVIPAFFIGSVFGALAFSAFPSAAIPASVGGGLLAAVLAAIWAYTGPGPKGGGSR